MLEFIIALLLSLGIQFDDASSMSKLDSETMDKVHAESKYQELGGDKEYDRLFGSIGDDHIVVTTDPNPPSTEEYSK
jgi:hypothetical protein